MRFADTEHENTILQGKCGRRLRPADLTVAFYNIFIGREFGQGHRTAGVELLGGDADLCSETELGAVGEGCGDVCIDAGCIYGFLEDGRCGMVFTDNAFAVP